MFCPNCGNQLSDHSAFCGNCGAKIGVAPVAQQPAGLQTVSPVMPQPAVQPVAAEGPVRRMHCPNCKSVNISISTESSVTGGLTTHQGGFSSTYMSNEHRNFWFCADCGTKFRNIQNLEEEIHRKRNYPTIFTVVTIVCFIIAIVFLVLALEDSLSAFLWAPYAGAFGITAIVLFCFIFSSKKRLRQMREELAYLKEHCFN